MTTKKYLKEWDLNEEKTPVKGFKIGDFVKVVGFSEGSKKDPKGRLIGRFGIIDSMKNNGNPDLVVFVTKNGKDTDEADLVSKFVLKPAKKCPGCGILTAVDEPCILCSKKQLKEDSLNEDLFDKVKLLTQSFKKNFKNTVLALSLAINLLAGINMAVDNGTEVNKQARQLHNKIENLQGLYFQSHMEKPNSSPVIYKTPEQTEKLKRQLDAQQKILDEVKDVYYKISVFKPAESQKEKIQKAIKKAETCIKFSEDTLKEIKEENYNDADVRLYHHYSSKFNDKELLKKRLNRWTK